MTIPPRCLSAAAFACLLASCKFGPDFIAPRTNVNPNFVNSELAWASRQEPVEKWWTIFGDSLLTRLVDQAADSNLDIITAAARVAEARAILNADRLEYVPRGNVTADQSRGIRSIQNGGTSAGVPQSARAFEQVNVGFDAVWEADLWGRVQRLTEASQADLNAIEAARRDVQIVVTAEVARNYFELRGLQNQIDVAIRNLKTFQETLNIVEVSLNAGRGTALDRERAAAQLEFTRATIPPLQASALRAIHRLSVLIGQQPSALRNLLAAARPMPPLPALNRIGSASALLQRRPDIRQAEYQLHAATARIGVITASLFPAVSFSGRVGLSAEYLGRLGNSGTDSYSFGPSISWPALQIPQILQQKRAAEARVDQALAQWQKTVLGALEETENSLSDFGRLRAQRDALRRGMVNSQRAAALARLRFQDGIDDFTTVLDAERSLLQAQDNVAAVETRTATALVAIYKALGGGWQGDRLEPVSK